MKITQILIADDHEVMRRGLRALLESEPGWHVCGEAATGREAVALALQLKPDIIVMDISMPELNGLDATRQIKSALPLTEIAILSAVDAEHIVHDVVQAGARAYVCKTEAGEQLVAALKALSERKPYFRSFVTDVLVERYLATSVATAPAPVDQPRLTPREREIVQLLGEGRRSKEAASTLGISVRTVETHRAAIMRKLELRTVSDLVRYAIRNGIVEA